MSPRYLRTTEIHKRLFIMRMLRGFMLPVLAITLIILGIQEMWWGFAYLAFLSGVGVISYSRMAHQAKRDIAAIRARKRSRFST